MNDKPPQITDLKEAQLLDQLWVMVNSLTEKVHSLEKKIKEQKGKLCKNSSKPPSTARHGTWVSFA